MKEMLQNKAIIGMVVMVVSVSLFANLAASTGNEIVSDESSQNQIVVEKTL